MRLIDADATIKCLREFRCKDCDRRKGMKNGKIRFCYEIGEAPCRACDIDDTIDYLLDEDISPTIDAVPMKEQEAVKPYIDIDEAKCPICKVKLTRQELLGEDVLFEDFFDYCPRCGRKVKWQ